MESQPQNPEFRNNPENLHPLLDILDELMHDIIIIYFLQSELILSASSSEGMSPQYCFTRSLLKYAATNKDKKFNTHVLILVSTDSAKSYRKK